MIYLVYKVDKFGIPQVEKAFKKKSKALDYVIERLQKNKYYEGYNEKELRDVADEHIQKIKLE